MTFHIDFCTIADCLDTDRDGFNDDLDNYPSVFNPTQAGVVGLADFAELASRWQTGETDEMTMEDLANFCQHWLYGTP